MPQNVRGASAPDALNGMSGGTLYIQGRAGVMVGARMRRGTLVIGGDADGYLGASMIAGTILAGGQVGARPGYGMRRGTLILPQGDHTLLPTFLDGGTMDVGILGLLRKALQPLDAGHLVPWMRVRRYIGDMASLGKGEILVGTNEAAPGASV